MAATAAGRSVAAGDNLVNFHEPLRLAATDMHAAAFTFDGTAFGTGAQHLRLALPVQ